MGVGAVSIDPHRSDACRPHVHPKSIENGCGGGTAFRTTLTQPSVKQRRIGETKGERKETLRLPFGFPLVSCGPRSVPAGVVEFPCGFPLVSCATPSVAAGVVESPVGFPLVSCGLPSVPDGLTKGKPKEFKGGQRETKGKPKETKGQPRGT
jgi:hypothetical protein